MSYRAAWGGIPALCQPQALLPLDSEQTFFNFFFSQKNEESGNQSQIPLKTLPPTLGEP